MDSRTAGQTSHFKPLRFEVIPDEKPGLSWTRTRPAITIQDSDGPLTIWQEGNSFIEVDAYDDRDPGDFRNVAQWNKVHEHAAEVMHYRARRFLVALCVFGDNARFFRWDRSTVIVSDSFKYKEDPAPLIEFLTCFGVYDDGYGFDDTSSTKITSSLELARAERQYQLAKKLLVYPECGDPKKDARWLGTSRKIRTPKPYRRGWEDFTTLGPAMAANTRLIGCGSRVWLASLPSYRKYVIIKDSWRDSTRWCEGDIYRRIYGKDKRVFGVARLYHYFDVEDVNSGEVIVTQGEALNEKLKRDKYDERTLHRCILASVGIPLSRFTSTRQLLEAVRDAIIGHKNMWERGVLHRDISLHNILISLYPKQEGGAKGFLIDPEYAVIQGEPGYDQDVLNVCGTPMFMSIDRQPEVTSGGPHEPWHDVESFYWLLVYVLAAEGRLVIHEYRWPCTLEKDEVQPSRRFVWKHVRYITVDEHEPLTKCMTALAKLVEQQYWGSLDQGKQPREMGAITHEAFLDAINKALDAEGWPEGDASIVAKAYLHAAGVPKRPATKRKARVEAANAPPLKRARPAPARKGVKAKSKTGGTRRTRGRTA
ncbi:hypothetical protein GLOTRDRAFT_131160 [Gloeophyllum trabeum ATCC 11539]|uniref:Fungal-type protein kinase domain-containing protein n=1 Tax=Gloeophyllum trabeum (strain ATCC 11539 / FP-39264 / Madison 617) TaxID=670483 RepID=S7RHR2_GLOTA|nr:uncharacterized protein GLOTRDRAFT_131160 [Gloeophyllum trabeum ATCC 11539]EPQ53830.1 hypothetical protein GLOTRDRAFT_131160 [Gloeophyllum trabeum ATCC 11539]